MKWKRLKWIRTQCIGQVFRRTRITGSQNSLYIRIIWDTWWKWKFLCPKFKILIEEMWAGDLKYVFWIDDADAGGIQTSLCPAQTFLYSGPPKVCQLLLDIFYPRASADISQRAQESAPPCFWNEKGGRVKGRILIVIVRVGCPTSLSKVWWCWRLGTAFTGTDGGEGHSRVRQQFEQKHSEDIQGIALGIRPTYVHTPALPFNNSFIHGPE